MSMAEPSQPPHISEAVSDPWPPEESPDGVDLTLIQWTLSLTPLQRLELLQDWVDGLAEFRRVKLSQASPPTTWRREEIYGDDGR